MSTITDSVHIALKEWEIALRTDYFNLLKSRDAWEQRKIKPADIYTSDKKEKIREANIQALTEGIKEVSLKLQHLDAKLRPPFQKRQTKACPTQHLKEIY